RCRHQLVAVLLQRPVAELDVDTFRALGAPRARTPRTSTPAETGNRILVARVELVVCRDAIAATRSIRRCRSRMLDGVGVGVDDLDDLVLTINRDPAYFCRIGE